MFYLCITYRRNVNHGVVYPNSENKTRPNMATKYGAIENSIPGGNITSYETVEGSTEGSWDGKSPYKFTVYRRRWYCLLLFALMALTQSLLWNTWGPIAASAKSAFFWTNAEISLLVSWGPVLYMLAVFPSVWLAETKGKPRPV